MGDEQGTAARRLGITGAMGFIGTHLVTRALEAGVEVRTFCRRSWSGAPFVPVEERRQLVLPRPPDPADLQGLDAVVHLAVAPHGSTEDTAVGVNVRGTVALYEAARAAGVPRFVFVSTQSAHDGARNRYGRTKREAERRLEGRPGVVIVRPGLAYDGGPRGLLGLASTAAAKLRVMPVMGGSDSIVQTIHLDDLCAALLRLTDRAALPEVPELVELAEPELRPLGPLVVATAEARFGVRPALLNIPLGAARAGAATANAIGIAEAVSEVVDGIVAFRPMDTAPQLEALGIEVRPFDASTFAPADAYVPVTAAATAAGAAPGTDARKLLLVGAGRIGSVHALCGGQHPDAVLAGLVDPSRQAVAQIQAMIGPGVPAYRSLEEALAAVPADAAVVATPPNTHDGLAIELLGHGVDVLVEKPVTPTADARRRLLDAAATVTGRAPSGAAPTVGAGYHFLQLPHLRRTADRFRAGDFGTLTGFCALGFVSRAVERGKQLSWELDPDRAGGGALPQVAAHALSILDLFCGPLEVLDATLLHAPERRVEDAAWVHLTNGTASGSLFTGWHLAEFVIPENSVRLATDRGVLVLSSASAVFFPADGGEPEVATCLDEPAGFDPTPNDGGAGYWLEQRALLAADASRNGLEVAARIEAVTTEAYRKAVRLRAEQAPPAAAVALATPAPRPPWVDVRRMADPSALVGKGATGERYVVGTTEHAALAASGAELLVVVPDLPRTFRTLTNEGPAAVVRSLGFGNLVKAGFGVRPQGALSATGRLWEAMGALLRAEVAALPRDFSGRLALDGYLVDLAGGLGRFDELVLLLRSLRKRFPHAELGLDTNAPDLVRALLPIVTGTIGFVLTIGEPAVDVPGRLRASAGDQSLEVLVKTGVQPHEVVAWAAAEPAAWEGSGGQLVADWRGADGFAPTFVDLVARAVRGTGAPDGAFADACELLGFTRPT